MSVPTNPAPTNVDVKGPTAVVRAEDLSSERVFVWKGDITTLQIDAIVNSANNPLLGGGGVDGAIHAAAGPGLYEDCKSIGFCATGEAEITKGHNLPAPYIIHSVGPIYYVDKNVAMLLESCYSSGSKSTFVLCNQGLFVHFGRNLRVSHRRSGEDRPGDHEDFLGDRRSKIAPSHILCVQRRGQGCLRDSAA